MEFVAALNSAFSMGKQHQSPRARVIIRLFLKAEQADFWHAQTVFSTKNTEQNEAQLYTFCTAFVFITDNCLTTFFR